MIKNDRQYRITKAQATKFARALKDLRASRRDRMLAKLEADALRSQLDELQSELAEQPLLDLFG